MRLQAMFILFLFFSTTFAQSPHKMSYQAVIRNADGNLVQNAEIGIAVSIVQGSENGTVVFRETHSVMTNVNGLIAVEIGTGNLAEGSMETIDWGAGPFYLRSETDPDGGSNYTISGSSELISVPFALYALRSGTGSGGGDSDWIEDIQNDEVKTSRNIVLEVGGTQPFRVNTNAPAGVARVIAGTNNGIGVHGSTDMGYGIRGEAGQGVGVHGVARNFGDAVLGEAQNGAGVHGKSMGVGVLGESELNAGVQGSSKSGAGVYGISEANEGIYGTSTIASGVYGESMKADGVIGVASETGRAGVWGYSEQGMGVFGESVKDDGIIGVTYASDKAGVLGNGGESSTGVEGLSINKIGVKGKSTNQNGVEGESDTRNGVRGETKAEVQEVFSLGPSGLGNGTGQFGGVSGFAQNAYGGDFNSINKSGAFARSTASNGITARSDASSEDRAAVYAGASSSAAGVLGWSVSGSGVKGKSNTGKAGEFEGEVHIENGMKDAKLKIDKMEDDNKAPILVWSADNYVRKRDGWTVSEDNLYFESDKGIRITNGGDAIFQVEPDGTSYHAGLETFEGGLIVPAGDVEIRLLPNDGISVYSEAIDDYLFHANLSGDAFADRSFFSSTIGADVIFANEKNFRIDHPLDPENKYLVHTSIESDERINVYSGNITTDDKGFAKVNMPAWFEALNTDFRYQLTVIGEFAQAIVKQEIYNGEFTVATSIPNVKVSWQVTGVRHDKWAKENPSRVEMDKNDATNRNR